VTNFELSLLNSEKKCCGDDRIIWCLHVYGPSHYLWNGIVNWGSFCTEMYLLHKCQKYITFLIIHIQHSLSLFLWPLVELLQRKTNECLTFFPQKIQRLHKPKIFKTFFSWQKKQGPYLQNFIFFVTYESAW